MFLNEQATLNQKTLNQNLLKQSTRRDSIQNLDKAENENYEKYENEARSFYVQHLK